MILERSWRSGDIPKDKKVANITCIYKKGSKEIIGPSALQQPLGR